MLSQTTIFHSKVGLTIKTIKGELNMSNNVVAVQAQP